MDTVRAAPVPDVIPNSGALTLITAADRVAAVVNNMTTFMALLIFMNCKEGESSVLSYTPHQSGEKTTFSAAEMAEANGADKAALAAFFECPEAAVEWSTRHSRDNGPAKFSTMKKVCVEFLKKQKMENLQARYNHIYAQLTDSQTQQTHSANTVTNQQNDIVELRTERAAANNKIAELRAKLTEVLAASSAARRVARRAANDHGSRMRDQDTASAAALADKDAQLQRLLAEKDAALTRCVDLARRLGNAERDSNDQMVAHSLSHTRNYGPFAA